MNMSGTQLIRPEGGLNLPCPDCGSPHARCQDRTTCPEAAMRMVNYNKLSASKDRRVNDIAITARERILDDARKCTTKDRNKEYGPPEDSFKDIGALWSAYLSGKVAPSVQLTPVDVGLMLTLMKVARLKTNPNHWDSKVDIAGYAACIGEMRIQDQQPIGKELEREVGKAVLDAVGRTAEVASSILPTNNATQRNT